MHVLTLSHDAARHEKMGPKQNFPLNQIRRHLETGPVVLVTSAWKGKTNVMTMGWHLMMEFEPALFGCYIWDANHSFEMIRKSRECVINVPTVDLVDKVVAVGNTTGAKLDKFEKIGLTPVAAEKVTAPLIKECYANFECRLADARMISRYGFFVWEVVKAHVAKSPKNPRTIHYRGQGQFMVAGRSISLRKKFKRQNL
ncbi:MAG TPA: flavin reductase family protein [Steroidobacteraceae bacterium]|nr:flavin reductase family protein [Steroidobacteraceae bacterium]